MAHPTDPNDTSPYFELCAILDAFSDDVLIATQAELRHVLLSILARENAKQLDATAVKAPGPLPRRAAPALRLVSNGRREGGRR